MAQIKTYEAPIQKITPDERGFTAAENMARRLGPLYNEAASSYEKIGQLTADEIKQRMWPFDILRLQQAANSGNISFRVGRSSGGGGSHGSSGSSGRIPTYRSLGEVSHGAGALGRAMSAAVDPDQAYSDKLNQYARNTGQVVGTDYGPGGAYERLLKPGESLAADGSIIGPNTGQGSKAEADYNAQYGPSGSVEKDIAKYNTRADADFVAQTAAGDTTTPDQQIYGQALAGSGAGYSGGATPQDQQTYGAALATNSYGAAASYLGNVFGGDQSVGAGDQSIGAGDQGVGP